MLEEKEGVSEPLVAAPSTDDNAAAAEKKAEDDDDVPKELAGPKTNTIKCCIIM